MKTATPRYKVINLTLPGHHETPLELGPVLVATYDREEFEVLYPFRAVVHPIAWEAIEVYGPLESPDAAVLRYLRTRTHVAPLRYLHSHESDTALALRMAA